VLSGLLRACEKRPVASNQLEKIVGQKKEIPGLDSDRSVNRRT